MMETPLGESQLLPFTPPRQRSPFQPPKALPMGKSFHILSLVMGAPARHSGSCRPGLLLLPCKGPSATGKRRREQTRGCSSLSSCPHRAIPPVPSHPGYLCCSLSLMHRGPVTRQCPGESVPLGHQHSCLNVTPPSVGTSGILAELLPCVC